jgi:hypothetical protein
MIGGFPAKASWMMLPQSARIRSVQRNYIIAWSVATFIISVRKRHRLLTWSARSTTFGSCILIEVRC